MANIPGTVVTSGLSPGNELNTHETHRALYGKGGHRTVPDLTARDAIPSPRREIGMTVYVVSELTTYRLVNGITNGDWVIDLGSASIIPKKELITPTLGQTVYNLAETPLAESLAFILNGSEKTEDIDYTVSGDVLTLSGEYGTGQSLEIQIDDTIVIRYLY